MARVLVTEEIAESGLERLRSAGHEVDVRLGLDDEALLAAVSGAHGLIIRSATTVTAEVLEAGGDLVVVGRAGIGLDNVDVDAATAQGVIVCNAPLSNAVTAAEHTMAMLLAQARNVAHAHAALVQGRWERSKWNGVELAEKTLGIIGLGRIGGLVAERAAAFDMRLIAYDPFVTAERAGALGADLVELDELMQGSDFVTLHLARTPETIGLIDAELLAKAKPGLRIVNVARGGIIDEDALADAVRNGPLGGAAIDVFATEPTTESPLFDLPQVTVTPHLGASTVEAQLKAGVTIAEQVELALRGDFVPFAVNLGAPDSDDQVKPFVPLAVLLGELYGQLMEQLPDRISVEFAGTIGQGENGLAALAALQGLLGPHSDAPISLVNAKAIAEQRGIALAVSSLPAAQTYRNVITISGGGHEVGGTIVGLDGHMRIVRLDGHDLDLRPSRNMVIVRNADLPGVIGHVGTSLGSAGVNIRSMNVGEAPAGNALMVIGTDDMASDEALEKLRAVEQIWSVERVTLATAD